MKPDLIFGDPDPERVKLLRQGFASHPQITARVLKPNELRTLPYLDAVYVSIMAAERWGSFVPRPRVHEARVLRTTPKDRADGWPPFVIAGLALGEGEDPFDARSVLPQIIAAVLKAVREFNAQGGESINTVGFWSDWTLIDRLPGLEAARIICAVYDESG